jgi:hypothetical protein
MVQVAISRQKSHTTITIESTWIRRVAVVHRHRRSSSNSVVSMVDGDIGALSFS